MSLRLEHKFAYRVAALAHIDALLDLAEKNEPRLHLVVWIEMDANDDYSVESEFYGEANEEDENEGEAGDTGAESGDAAPDGEDHDELAGGAPHVYAAAGICHCDDCVRDRSYPVSARKSD